MTISNYPWRILNFHAWFLITFWVGIILPKLLVLHFWDTFWNQGSVLQKVPILTKFQTLRKWLMLWQSVQSIGHGFSCTQDPSNGLRIIFKDSLGTIFESECCLLFRDKVSGPKTLKNGFWVRTTSQLPLFARIKATS